METDKHESTEKKRRKIILKIIIIIIIILLLLLKCSCCKTEDKLIKAQLDKMGIDCAAIKYVVMSHFHCDHAGYLYLFNNSEVIVAQDEYDNAMKLYESKGFGPGPYKYADFDEFLKTDLKWRLLPDAYTDYEIVPGVKAVCFGSGHTFSLTGLSVNLSDEGNFLFTADALYRSENLGPPVRIPGLIFDSLGYVKSANYIAEYAEKNNAKIIFGHDKKQFASLKIAPSDYYQ